MDAFTPAIRSWFDATFDAPTRVQAAGWAQIAAGRHALLLAPTGSGKTLAAFLWGIDRVARLEPDATPGVRVLYVSPLKALVHDVERNLRAPLAGIETTRPIRVDVRTGDTPASERARQRRDPGEILVTTPESLYLLLGSQARAALATVHTVIVDEVHALAPTKRGVHLALSLERLAALCPSDPQRIGLSATVRPADDVARFLGGTAREVEVVDAVETPRLTLRIATPLGDRPMRPVAPQPGEPGEHHSDGGIWPSLYPELVELICAHTSTIVFVNSRGLCEKLAKKLNEGVLAATDTDAATTESTEPAAEPVVRAHHGSVSHTERGVIEAALKQGQLRCIVATSSLELGIDMGAVDLVVLVESPGSVARGLQRVGRAGHEVGGTSRGIIFPKLRGDLLECTVVSRRMLAGDIEALAVPRNALDVLAQQIVAMVCDRALTVDEVAEIVGRASPFADLSRQALLGVLDLLSGRYPADEFADLRPRLAWDRSENLLTPRRGAAMLARLNAGTIPDRGLYTVHQAPGGARVGELDEEMVHETRLGDVVLLGASSWRVTEITRDRVLVVPAPGEPGRVPFWRGDGLGRPLELGRAVGEFTRELAALDPADAIARLTAETPLDAGAARALVDYVAEQRAHTGGVVPTDRAITVERFRDEVGDWRVVILSPFGLRVHAPWALALQTSLGRRCGFEVSTQYTDDGIVLTFADGDAVPPAEALVPDPDELEDLVTEQVAGSALFGAAFRENAARALLLPRRAPGRRTPLWAQRIKARTLLAAVQRFPDFPILLETYRQCLQDVFDLPGLAEILRGVRSRAIRLDEVETQSPSPFAGALVFAHVSTFMYEYDAPLAERRAQALTLDRGLLRDLLGHAELRELLDAGVLAALESELQRTADTRRARDPDELHDVLRAVGALELGQVVERCADRDQAVATEWLRTLRRQGRALTLEILGAERWLAAQDVGLYVRVLGADLPRAVEAAVPTGFLEAGAAPLEAMLRRHARTHGPVTRAELGVAFGCDRGVTTDAELDAALAGLEAEGALVRGAFLPVPRDASPEWCDAEVLRRLKRRTLVKLRSEVAAVADPAYARFLLDWHGVGAVSDGGGPDRGDLGRLREVLLQLEGAALPWSAWIGAVLPARVRDFEPQQLDALCAAGEFVWVGCGALGARDGRVAFYQRDAITFLHTGPAEDSTEDSATSSPASQAILEHLRDRGASFLGGLQQAVDAAPAEFERALQDLVWSGQITNDTTAPLRALSQPQATRGAGRGGGRGIPGARRSRGAASARNAGGRWSLVADLFENDPGAETEIVHARATALLERFGVVSRDVARAAELPGGFGGVYRMLEAMEETGRIRRGHFVAGLEGAQFAAPGVVDRLREDSSAAAPRTALISVIDPANPWGSVFEWPATTREGVRPRRTAGAWLVLHDGCPALWVAANRRSLVTFVAATEDASVLAVALGLLHVMPTGPAFVLEQVDGVPTAESELRGALERTGFTRDYRGWSLRPAAPSASRNRQG